MNNRKKNIQRFLGNGCSSNHFNGWFIFFLTLCFFTSCIDEDTQTPATTYGEPVSVTLSAGFSELTTRGYNDGPQGAIADTVIKDLRVLIFNTAGEIAYNEYIPELSVSNPFKLSLKKGTYDFVFIANESSDPTMTTKLDAFTGNRPITDLQNVTFPSSAFNNTDNIPMAHIEKQVEILNNNKYKIGATEYTGTWEVELTRLAIRLDIKIFTESKVKKDDFKGIETSNIPNAVPILETNVGGNTIYNGGTGNWETSPRSYSVASGDNGGFETTQGGYQWILSRIILPSSVFTPDNQSNAIKLKVLYEDREDETEVLQATGSTSYLAPRNNYYTIEGTLKMEALEIYMGVEDWDERLFDVSLLEQKLNVSRIEASINEHNMARIYFWSDQKEVFIEDLTSDNENVDDIFYDLTGINPQNFHYQYNNTTGEGAGYFDIITDRDKALVNDDNNTYEHKIYLNAGELKREITVKVSIPSTDFAAYDYVGAFWRNNQTGERIIAGENTGNWTATVTSGNFIILSPGKSLDEKIWTDGEPADAENYQVEGTETTVAGTGKIYFRIGLTGTNAGTPRYGKVTVTQGNGNTYDIYVRQGEEADYLMRPEDYGLNLPSSGGIYRPNAGKFSPYNLTSQEYLDGVKTGGKTLASHSQINVRGGVFTEYPSQAGALFQWANSSDTHTRIAWHPTNPNTASASMWNSTLPVKYWSELYTEHEICPPGYRRPHEGSINKDVENTTMDEIAETEMRASLWLNPQTGRSTNNMDNNLFGYYADGFFDRRVIVSSINVSVSNPNTTVSVSNNDVAYVGRLFYNPNSNASLFFPMTGYRHAGNAALYTSGTTAYYITSTTTDLLTVNNYAWQTIIGPTFSRMSNNSKDNAMPIRCVVDEPFAKLIWTNKDRVLADEDALLNGTTGAAQMNWAQAMGINTTYNSTLFYNSGFSTNEMSNYGYSNNSQMAASPKTGCAAYWQGDENDPVTGIGKWYLPVPEEFKDLHDTGKFLSGTSQNQNYGYWTSGENDLNQGCLLTCSSQNVGTPTYQSKTGTIRENHTRCVRNPTAEELAWRLANK